MLIKINELSDTCEDLKQEVEDLMRRIDSLLRQEKREKEVGDRKHLEERKVTLDTNTLLKQQLKAMLTNVNH